MADQIDNHDKSGVLTGDRLKLEIPAAMAYLGAVARLAQEAAGLAGFGPNQAGRARLIAEEVFAHIVSECAKTGLRENCEAEFHLTADGLELVFITQNLSYRPDNLGEYSLDSVLESGDAGHLGLFLVRTYAQNISLTTRGPARRLCISLARKPDDGGSRQWSALVPGLAPGLTLARMEHKGKLVRRLDDANSGKSFIVRSLAHQILSLVDGHTDFGAIMAKTLKVMPEKRAHQVEDLFEVLIQKGLVQVTEKPLVQAEVKVKRELEPLQKAGYAAYRKEADKA